MIAPKKRPGRPATYKPTFAIQAEKLCKLGATDADLANFFGVTDRTINRWQITHPEFCRALKAGKVEADDRVERSLYHKAVGYEFEAVKIFMPAGAQAPVYAPYRERVPPDTTAAIFWLKNRRPELWRDVHKIDTTVQGTIEVTDARQRLAHLITGQVAAAEDIGGAGKPH